MGAFTKEMAKRPGLYLLARDSADGLKRNVNAEIGRNWKVVVESIGMRSLENLGLELVRELTNINLPERYHFSRFFKTQINAD